MGPVAGSPAPFGMGASGSMDHPEVAAPPSRGPWPHGRRPGTTAGDLKRMQKNVVIDPQGWKAPISANLSCGCTVEPSDYVEICDIMAVNLPEHASPLPALPS